MDTIKPQRSKRSEKMKSVARRLATAGTGGLLVAVAGYATLTGSAEAKRIGTAPMVSPMVAAAIAPVVRDASAGALVSGPTEINLVKDSSAFTAFSDSSNLTTPTTQPSTANAAGLTYSASGVTLGVAKAAFAITPTLLPDTTPTTTPTTLPTFLGSDAGFSGVSVEQNPLPTLATTINPNASVVNGANNGVSANPFSATATAKAVATNATPDSDDTTDTNDVAGVHDVQTAGVTWQPATQPAQSEAFVANSVRPEGPSDANPDAPPTHKYPPDHPLAADPKAPPAHWAPPASNARPAQDAPVAATPAATPVHAGFVTSGLNDQGKIALTLNRTVELKTKSPVKRVSIGQPEIADVQPFNSNMILVTAKKPGTTQVIVWDDKDQSQSIDVSVEIPLDQLKDLISKVAPNATIDVAVANDQIVLRGQAPNLTVAKQVSDLAGAYGKVQNFIEVAGAQTVAVQVQFAEVSRSVTNDLGVSWAYQNGTSIFGSDPVGSGLLGYHTAQSGVIDGISPANSPGQFNIFGLGSISGNPFAYFIKALRDNNLLRILQEPTLTTTSGEAASFLAGGQVPVPVPADNGQVAIEYKEFGVRLKLTPVVLGNGKIRLVMEAESSQLDYANGTTITGAAVPGLRTRRVQNTVELGEGQTISVAGLLDDSVTASKREVPLLGDIPVLGQLFRSTRYQRQETELVVLITPRLTGAMNPDQVTPLPGAAWRHPNDLEQFAFGDLGGNKEADAVKDWNKPASQRGLKPTDTQKSTMRAQEPAAISSDTTPRQPQLPQTPPPEFIGEHGFVPPEPDVVTTARD